MNRARSYKEGFKTRRIRNVGETGTSCHSFCLATLEKYGYID